MIHERKPRLFLDADGVLADFNHGSSASCSG